MTQQRVYARHTQKKRAHQRQEYRKRKARQHRERQEKRHLMFRLQHTIDQHFPNLYEKIKAIPECRKQPHSTMLERILAGIAMFLFKKEFRNAMNNERDEPQFRKNYKRLFNARLPHMDTVEDSFSRSYLNNVLCDVMRTDFT
ncbi:MAG: hypothetical protein GY801_48380 [bacterium]|nr:hypothetical protein [bacterium]